MKASLDRLDELLRIPVIIVVLAVMILFFGSVIDQVENHE